MAHYVRFEIYIPVVYTAQERDPTTKGPNDIVHALDEKLVASFIRDTYTKYHGVTQANPIAPPLYKGWWKAKLGRPVDVDHLTFLFGLVRVDQGAKALEFFQKWKRRIEGVEHQNVILLMYYPVQTVGDFF